MENEVLFKEVVEHSGDIVIVTDRQFLIRYISSSVRKVFDVDPVALLGRNVFSYLNPEKIQGWKNCIAGKQPLFDEVTLKTRDGRQLFFDVHISNLIDHYQVQGLVLKLHDVTGKKIKEQELLRSNKQLDQVIYKTTHDLKAPVMSALGLVDLAEKSSAEDQAHYLQMIRKSLLKLDSLIGEMYNFFRNEKLVLQRSRIDLHAMLKEELENLISPLEENIISVDFEISGDHQFFSDRVRVQTVITNILSNAIKYYDRQKTKPFIKISISVNPDICILKVEDNGIGIEPEYQNRIFDLFFRATDHAQGTGLGLFIVKDTIEKLEGTIDVQSTPGSGTTFLIRIPNQLNQPLAVE
ncbi:MAG: PAS domain S-box protein [Cyclobacteriaceae bacterium]|nr:PAS domain S-box protein [Cyclobacteriaceae bacterium]